MTDCYYVCFIFTLDAPSSSLQYFFQLLIISLILGTFKLPRKLETLKFSTLEEDGDEEGFSLHLVEGLVYNLAHLVFKQMYPEKTLKLISQ